MEDLFEREQTILNHALARLHDIQNGTPCSTLDYALIVEEYKRLLKQLRRMTRISDKTTIDLNASRLDLQDKVHFDELTGIYNRRFLDESFQHILCALSPERGFLSLLMIDVDFFKRYNDTYGHDIGDACLRTVAQTLNQSILRAKDFVARYGGEEFVVILQNTDQTGANVMANRILKNITDCHIIHEKNEVAPYVTVSIGVTTGRVKSTDTMTDYIRAADKALYHSKQNGRNKSTFIDMGEYEL
ncbi:MAG: GGDEF domain-containing protein [Evtepia sp.]